MNVSQIILLHSRADRLMRSLVDECIDEYDLTLMEWLLLSVVQGGPKEGLSMSAVSRELDVTLPQVTALMTSVVKKKLIKLKTQRKDRRSRHALLTNKGEQTLANVENRVESALKKWFAEMDNNEVDAYTQTLQKLAVRDQQVQAGS